MRRTLARLVRIVIVAGLGLLAVLVRPAAANERLVLIAGAANPLTTLSSGDVHKLFLGLTVAFDDIRLRPLRNDADELMRRVFFQNVVSMSEAVYDRRMLAITLQQGRAAPPVARNTAEVIEALVADPSTISFAWAHEVENDRRIKVLRVLWNR